MIKFLHAADVHLDSPLHMLERYEGAPVSEMRLATRRALVNLVDLAIEQGVGFVVLSGDIYDGDWRDFNTGLFFVAQMRRLLEAGIQVVLIAGNHDAANKMTRTLRLPHGVSMLSAERPQTVHLESVGVALHGQSFARPNIREDLARHYPHPETGVLNIGVLHTCAEGREGHESYAPCRLSDLKAKGYDYWALGHIHRREVLLKEPWIAFPGNIQGRHIRETGPKGCFLVTSHGDRLEVEFRALDVARWELAPLDVSDFDDDHDIVLAAAALCDSLRAAADDRPVVARLELTGASDHADHWHTRLDQIANEIRAESAGSKGSGLWLEKVVWKVRTPDDSQEVLAADGPLSYVIREMRTLGEGNAESRALTEELEEFLRKLPPEVASGLRADGEDWMREILDEARPLLMDKLLASTEERA